MLRLIWWALMGAATYRIAKENGWVGNKPLLERLEGASRRARSRAERKL